MATRQSYSAKFKHEAVQMLERGDRKVGQVSRDLGVHRSLLAKWRAEAAQEQAAVGAHPKRDDQRSEMARLKRELARVTEERDILKKAAQYFAKELP